MSFLSLHRCERIFAEAEENDHHYYYVKWENLPYNEATWELEDLAKERFTQQVHKIILPLRMYRHFLCIIASGVASH